MATETLAARLGERRAASTASGGTALSTTAVAIGIPDGTRYVQLIPWNYSTAVVLKVAYNPYLIVLKTADSLATVTDYSVEAQDGSTSTDVTLSSLDTLANGDALWIGSHVPFRGVAVDVDAANGTASVLAGHYWDGNSVEALSVTDGSTSGGATFAIDGSITWTMPSDWAAAPLSTIASPGADVRARGESLYWVRLSVSVALDSSTTLNSILALSRSTAYAEYPAGVGDEGGFSKGPGSFGCIEALVDAGTASLIVNCFAPAGGRFVG